MTENNQPKSKRGGARPGAGRKTGSVTKKTREIADKAAREGITPLEVMIEAMREAYGKGGAIAAVPYARDAAPYMHPKISATEVTGKDGAPLMPTSIVVCGPEDE
jgi:hypothetical protein